MTPYNSNSYLFKGLIQGFLYRTGVHGTHFLFKDPIFLKELLRSGNDKIRIHFERRYTPYHLPHRTEITGFRPSCMEITDSITISSSDIRQKLSFFKLLSA